MEGKLIKLTLRCEISNAEPHEATVEFNLTASDPNVIDDAMLRLLIMLKHHLRGHA